MATSANNNAVRLALVATIAAVALVATGAVLGIVVYGDAADKTPLITTVFGFAGTTIASLVALLIALGASHKAEDADAKAERLGKDLADW